MAELRRIRVVVEGVVRATDCATASSTARKAAKAAGIIGAKVTNAVDEGPVENVQLEPADVEQEIDVAFLIRSVTKSQ